ncbi:MAG: hypothetical protein AB7O66_00815 [Limisphaerales bacterium]
MAIKSEIGWTRRNEDGEKVEVTARRFGGNWSFQTRQRRYDLWQDVEQPPLEDWLELAAAVKRRIPRRLYPPDELHRIHQEIRNRFPEARLDDSAD